MARTTASLSSGTSLAGERPDGASDPHLGSLDKRSMLRLIHRVPGALEEGHTHTYTHTPQGCLVYELQSPQEQNPKEPSAQLKTTATRAAIIITKGPFFYLPRSVKDLCKKLWILTHMLKASGHLFA